MFVLFENTLHAPHVLARAPTYAAIVDLAHAHASFDIVYFQADAENPGCADFFTRNGNVYCIEPAARCGL